ncbi:MAG: sensor histidine kinase [Archangium sp.]
MKRWWLSLVLMLAATLEVFVRDDLPSRPAALAFTACIAAALVFRRSHPLAATGFAFSVATVTTVVRHHFGWAELAPASSIAVLALVYSLTRWGSRREVLVGAAFVAMTWLTSLLSGEMKNAEEIIGSAVVLILPGTIGGVVRFRDEAQVSALENARSLEREHLARELHDSVAHHVTAITLQAQAARAVIDVSPSDAKNALKAIEDESKRTLLELRSIVGTLRDERAPTAGLNELLQLKSGFVKVEVNAAGLSPVMERALFRLAQEAVTNATKHARNATCVNVRVTSTGELVHFEAEDDGELSRRGDGFGLVGMKERVTLLGGTFEAGPLRERGWRVRAVIPR